MIIQKKAFIFVLNNFKNDSRVLKQSKSLLSWGYSVKVLALHENGMAISESIQGVNVERINLSSRSWSKHILVQLIKLLEWTIVVWWRARQADVVHCNDLNTLHVGVLLKILSIGRIKVVYDAHEYETEINGLDGLKKLITSWIERGLIIFADAVITVSDGIAKEYVRLYKIEKPTLVLNCPPYQDFPKKNLFREKFGIATDQTIFLYQGGLAKGRGIEILLDAFTEIEPSKVIVFMGYGQLEGKICEYAERYKNIFYNPAVAPDILLDYTGSANYGILFYENSCLNHAYCSPNKMFEYLMAGLPVIVSNLPEMKRVVEENGIGIVAGENTVEGLRDAIQRADRVDRSEVEAGIAKCKLIYNWEEQEKNLKAVYDTL